MLRDFANDGGFVALKRAAEDRVPTPPGKSWIFFLENSRTWKVLENHFGPGKSGN